MAINVTYQPRADVVYDAAFIDGAGDFNRWLDQKNFRDQQAAQAQQRYQQQAVQHALDRQAQLQSQNANAARQLGLAAWNRQNELTDQQANRGFQKELVQDRRNVEVADDKTRRQFAVDDMNLRRQQELEDQQRQLANQQSRDAFQWEKESADSVFKGIDTDLFSLSKQRKLMEPDDQKKLAEISSQWRAIAAQRGKAPPEVWTATAMKFRDDLAQTGIANRIQQPENYESQLKQETFDDPKYGLIGRDRSGANRLIAKKPEDFTKPTAAGFHTWLEKNRDRFSSEDGTPASKDVLIRRYFAEVSMAREVDELATKMADPAFVAPQPVDPQQGQIEAWQQFARDSGFDIRPGGGVQPQQAPRSDTMSHSPVIDGGFGPMATGGQSAPQPQQPIVPRHLNEVPPQLREQYKAALPQPKTPQEAATLPPGTLFLTPDGRIKTVPEPSLETAG